MKGFYNCTQAVVGHMKANGGGVILNMASIAGSAGLADRFAYSVSKGAVIAMTFRSRATTWRTRFAATASRRRESTRRSSTAIFVAIIPARKRKSSPSFPPLNRSAEWPSPTKSPLSRCTSAPTKPHSSPASTTRSTAASSTCAAKSKRRARGNARRAFRFNYEPYSPFR